MSIVDKEAAIKLLAGTIARGILWITAAATAKWGLETIDQNTAAGLGLFAASAIVALVSLIWSKKKDTKLLMQTPPEK